MYHTLSHLRELCFCKRVAVWGILLILTGMLPLVNIMAQQPEASGPGELLWKFETGTRLRTFTHTLVGATSPAIDNNVIYFGGIDGNLYAVDKQSGRKLWQFETGGSVFARPSALVRP